MKLDGLSVSEYIFPFYFYSRSFHSPALQSWAVTTVQFPLPCPSHQKVALDGTVGEHEKSLSSEFECNVSVWALYLLVLLTGSGAGSSIEPLSLSQCMLRSSLFCFDVHTSASTTMTRKLVTHKPTRVLFQLARRLLNRPVRFRISETWT